ncbi:MAG: HAMP domain-containing histidine kinase [Patescibacteria group bacterium]|nr:HAMP domain-containing histidine kinase [Patescibacteria group bacterium]
MFKKTQLKLTVIYSLLFLILFWGFSFGIYYWMEHSFGEGYISKVRQVQQQDNYQGEFEDQATKIAMVSGDVALNQLRDILLTMNGIFLIIIPMVAWRLAKKSLAPIEIMYEQQKQFVSDASHELRTPLSIIKGEFDVLLKKKRASIDYQKTVRSGQEEVNRLIALVESLLVLARTQPGNDKRIPMSLVDMPDVINTVINKLSLKIKKKRLSLRFKPPTENIPFYGQELLLYQLFYNLIDNAITYTPKKGTVWITIEYKKSRGVVMIRDTGIGIPVSHLKKIFDRFYRVDSSRTQTKGFGLGLAIAKAAVEKHKGRITVSSEEGKGTIFTVILPLVASINKG